MDKYEYNLRNEEINTLIGRREFQKAVAIADTIDWTKVRSVKTLCKISDLYKVNKRYKESRILLEQALVRYPNGKTIVSSLCDLCIKMNDILGAMEYYKQFVQMAPTDNIKFILLYKIYEAQEATLDERIEVLEGLKKRERIEKWCYELALLYHRTGLTSKCVEECDDLILWFREGKYVKKAMELKMLHQQLTQPQDVLYQNMLDPEERAEYIDRTAAHAAVMEKIDEEPDDVLVKTVDVGQYSTINIQKALEESIKGSLSETPAYQTEPIYSNYGTGTIEQGDDVTQMLSAVEPANINYELEANIRQTGNLSIKHTGEIYLEQPEEQYAEEQPVEQYYPNEQPVEEYYPEEQPTGELYADGDYPEEQPTGELYADGFYPEEQSSEQYPNEQPAEQYAEEQPAADLYVNEHPAENYGFENPAEYNPEHPVLEHPVEEVVIDEPAYKPVTRPERIPDEYVSPVLQDTAEMQELFFEDTTGSNNQNKELTIEVVEDIKEETKSDDIALQIVFPDVPVTGDTIVYSKEDIAEKLERKAVKEEAEAPQVESSATQKEEVPNQETVAVPQEAPVSSLATLSNASKEELMELIDRKVAEALENAMRGQTMTPAAQPRKDSISSQVAPPRSMQKMLSQEYNGQISLVVPEQDMVEKQITGQINLDDYLSSWEDTKQQNKQKYEEELKSKLLQETGNLFSDFELQARDSILTKLEEEGNSAPIDADKEYEEYLKKILAESENEETNEESEDAVANDETAKLPVVEDISIEEDTPSQTEDLPEVEEIEEVEDEVDIPEEDSQKAAEIELIDAETEDDVEELEEIEDVVEEITDEPATEESGEETVEEPEIEDEESESTGEVAEEPEIEEVEEAAEESESTEEVAEESEKEETVEESEESKEDVKDAEPEESEAEESEAKEEEAAEENIRDLTDDEISLFSQFFQTKKARQNLTKALDNISLASHTGNVFVSGEMGEEPVELAKNVVQYAKISDANFSGKIGKVSGMSLNGKDLAITVGKMTNGGLIIERAGDMREETVKALLKVLNQDNLGVLVVMQDTKSEMNKMYNLFPEMAQVFNVQIEIEELSDDALVAFGRKYAERMEYSIDEMGILALHTRIDEMQTSDHVVTVADVRDIVDDAIENATRFSPKHITDIIFGKRYDDDDMIILKERDFNN